MVFLFGKRMLLQRRALHRRCTIVPEVGKPFGFAGGIEREHCCKILRDMHLQVPMILYISGSQSLALPAMKYRFGSLLCLLKVPRRFPALAILLQTFKGRIWCLPVFLVASLLYVSCHDNRQMSGNPLFRGNYADPEIALFGDTYWIFPTRSTDFDSQVALDAFSSKDLAGWTRHVNIVDSSTVKWVRRALWAPAVVEKDGRYFLFFGANDIQWPQSPWWRPEMEGLDQHGGIGIAVADNPAGPYADYLGEPLISGFYNNAQPIDQFIFKDFDNQYYIIYGGWGRCNIGRLNEDFTAMLPFPDGSPVQEITPAGYVEGPVMFYREDKLYFMWSEGNWADDTYNVAYAISDSPFGPFERIGTVIEPNPSVATGAGHHSVLNIPGTDDWYFIYHRRPVPNEHRDHRVTCIEYMYFNPDGTIKPVVLTAGGVKRRLP